MMPMQAEGEKEIAGRPGRGRPRAFDADTALDSAMRVFWRNGYEGTSLSDLTAAMGINRPSLYAAFGDKEALFRQVLDRYAAGPAAYLQAAMLAPTARATVEGILLGAIDLVTAPENPDLCLIAQGTLVSGKGADAIRQEVNARRQRGEAALRARLERAVQDGELPPQTDADGLARYFVTIARGLGISALGGATRDELQAVVQLALQNWPSENPLGVSASAAGPRPVRDASAAE